MKIFKEKVRKRVLIRWLGYIAAAYLLASLGVNAEINLLQDLKSAVMRTEELKIENCPDGIVISCLDENVGKGGAFLSFRIEDAANYSFELPLYIYPLEGEEKKAAVKVWKGWNSVDMCSFLTERTVWEKMVVPQAAVESEKIVVKDAVLSARRKTDTGRMLYVFVSFLFLTAFWECVCWVKERYGD